MKKNMKTEFHICVFLKYVYYGLVEEGHGALCVLTSRNGKLIELPIYFQNNPHAMYVVNIIRVGIDPAGHIIFSSNQKNIHFLIHF